MFIQIVDICVSELWIFVNEMCGYLLIKTVNICLDQNYDVFVCKCMFDMANITRAMTNININLSISHIKNYVDILRTYFRLQCCCYKSVVIYLYVHI